MEQMWGNRHYNSRFHKYCPKKGSWIFIVGEMFSRTQKLPCAENSNNHWGNLQEIYQWTFSFLQFSHQLGGEKSNFFPGRHGESFSIYWQRHPRRLQGSTSWWNLFDRRDVQGKFCNNVSQDSFSCTYFGRWMWINKFSGVVSGNRLYNLILTLATFSKMICYSKDG